uniref:Spermatogenesis-associated protein 31E1-like n=1 Tax=Tursiops truncatus TaxID=9739 RepID=A0A6J3RKC3_TURTR|nr:spermatogenesis-associated protein 31E1-like [Tursiops truncatus]
MLFPLKSTFDTWQYSSCTLCVSDIILAFLCGLGLFFLLLRYLENNVSSPPPRKHENIRKHQMEPKGRRKINEKKRAVKACRNSLKELEKARDLISLLRSHLHKLPDKGGFHQLSCQDPLGEVGKAAPAAAHQPCREPAEDDVPAVCPSAALVPLTQGSLPVASTLSTEPEDQSNLKRVTLGTVAKSSPPGNSFLASTTAAILSLGLAYYHILFLSCWWKITKALFFPTASQSKSWQEHLSHQPPGAPSSGGPTDKQVETGSPLFVNPEVQKLLELLITKKVKLNTCKEKEKDGSFSEQMSSDYHLNTLGNMWKSLGAEQDNTTPQSFWNMKDNTEQLEQLPGPQQLLHSEVLRDHLEQKYSQLYWGLPSLHSESLVAVRSAAQQQKQHLQKRLIKEQTKRGLARSIHLSPSLELSSSQCQFLGTYQAQGKQGPWQPSAFTGKRRLDRQKIRSRCPRRSRRKGQMQFQPGQDFGKGLRPCLRRISKASSRTSLPVKFLLRNSEKESERYLMSPLKSNSGNCLPSSPEQKHLEKFLKAHLSTKLRQINQGMTPVMVRQSWLAANYASYKPHPREEIRNLASSKYWKPCVNSSRELSFLSPSIRQMLEAHVIRWRVRHRWGLPNQAFEPINLKPGGAQSLSSPRSTFSPSATCQSRAHSKVNLANKLSGKPQPHQGMKVITKATVPTLVSPLPVPSPEHTEIQRALGKTSPGDRYGLSEAPLNGQEGRLPYQMPIVNLMGRSWENGTVLGFPATRKTLSPPTKSVAQPPKEPCLKTQVAQGRATGELLPDSHSDILLQDYAIGMPLQDFATNVLLQDHRTDVLLSSDILASHRSLSSSQREHASEDAPAFQVVPYDLNVREQSSRGQQTFKTPQLQDPFKGQREMSAPTEEWRDFQRPQPKEHEEMKSQREMLASAEEWRGFTKPQPGQHEETKSQSNVPAPAEEWRCVRSLQAGEHEETRSNQEQQEPRKPKVRDPCKDKFASTEGREDNWKPKPGEYKERSSGLKASQASGMSHASQVRERGESLGSKHPQLSPGKRQLSPESQKRTRQYVSHDKKGKGIEESLQKGKPASATAHQQKPIKGKPVGESRAIDPCATARAFGQVLREKLGLHQGLCASKLNLHPEQLQAPAQGHSHHHRVLSSSEQRRVLKDTAYSHQTSPKDHSYLNKSRHTTGRGDKLAFPPRELESPVRRRQHGPRLAGDSGHLRHHPACPQKCVPSGQPEVGCRGRRQVAEVPINGTVTKEPLASHHRVQAQRKEVRGQWLTVAPAQTLPRLQLPEPSQREGAWSSPPQRVRLPEAVESPSREGSLPHNVVNQLSQDWELTTDSPSVTFTYTCGPRRLPGDRWDLTGSGTVLGS